jgi:hypothetical protein
MVINPHFGECFVQPKNSKGVLYFPAAEFAPCVRSVFKIWTKMLFEKKQYQCLCAILIVNIYVYQEFVD